MDRSFTRVLPRRSTTHGHVCILVLRPWIDQPLYDPHGKTRQKLLFVYTSRLKTSGRNPYGKTQHMVDDPRFGGYINLSMFRWIDKAILYVYSCLCGKQISIHEV